MSVYCGKTAVSIYIPFGVVGQVVSMNDGGPNIRQKGANFGGNVDSRNRVFDGRAHWCHLANTF